MKSAQTLIEAVQLGDTNHLAKTIEFLTKSAILPVERKRVLSSALPQTGLTALHVAAKYYALAATDGQRAVYNEMIKMLLIAGAEPFAECLFGSEKLTPMQVAGGKRPPALIDHISELADRDGGQDKQRNTPTTHSSRQGMDPRQRAAMSGGYGFYYAVGGHSTPRNDSTEIATEIEKLRTYEFLGSEGFEKMQRRHKRNKEALA